MDTYYNLKSVLNDKYHSTMDIILEVIKNQEIKNEILSLAKKGKATFKGEESKKN